MGPAILHVQLTMMSPVVSVCDAVQPEEGMCTVELFMKSCV